MMRGYYDSGHLRIARYELRLLREIDTAVTWQSCLRCRQVYPSALLRTWCMHCLGAGR